MIKSNNFQIIWSWSEIQGFVGPIKIGESSKSVIQKYKLIRTPEHEAIGQELYEFEDKSSISVENELINGVECKSIFFYKNTNLIGLSTEEVTSLIGCNPSVDDDFEDQICLDFDEYGFMLWINKKSRVVESVFYYGK